MSGYTKPCIFCKQDIRMSNDTGKWTPYNLDNTAHECKKSSQSQSQSESQSQTHQEPNKKLTLENIDFRLQRLEAKILEVFGAN